MPFSIRSSRIYFIYVVYYAAVPVCMWKSHVTVPCLNTDHGWDMGGAHRAPPFFRHGTSQAVEITPMLFLQESPCRRTFTWSSNLGREHKDGRKILFSKSHSGRVNSLLLLFSVWFRHQWNNWILREGIFPRIKSISYIFLCMFPVLG